MPYGANSESTTQCVVRAIAKVYCGSVSKVGSPEGLINSGMVFDVKPFLCVGSWRCRRSMQHHKWLVMSK